jgi:hypothetical protein
MNAVVVAIRSDATWQALDNLMAPMDSVILRQGAVEHVVRASLRGCGQYMLLPSSSIRAISFPVLKMIHQCHSRGPNFSPSATVLRYAVIL